ncbi:MAG: hypothetical protein MJ250_09345 [Alphaproteobacteria bacterium]|nr:hypothetical protein [Alphaproteobacteria bacterium]
MTYEMNIKRVNLFTVVIPVILYISCLILSLCVDSRIFVLTVCLLPGMYMLFMTFLYEECDHGNLTKCLEKSLRNISKFSFVSIFLFLLMLMISFSFFNVFTLFVFLNLVVSFFVYSISSGRLFGLFGFMLF